MLADYRQGKLDNAQRKQVDEWFDSFGYGTDIEPFRHDENVNRIHRELTTRLEARITATEPIKQLYGWLPKVAAAVLVAVLAAGWLWRMQGNRLAK